MSTAQAKVIPAPGAVSRWTRRLLWLVVASVLIGWVLRRSAEMAQGGDEPAGFKRGVLHGVLMPIALPNLLVGHDVPIYAVNNNGRLYKLGYTVGVNGCGAFFFGFTYWRLLRLRRAIIPPGP